MALKYKPLPYIGSKYSLSEWVIKHFPNDDDFTTFVDVFGGAGNITVNIIYKYKDKKNYVYNDLFKPLVTFFSVLRDEEKYNKLIRKIRYTEFSRELYEQLEDFILMFKEGKKIKNENFYNDDVNVAWALFTKLHLNKNGVIRKRVGFDIITKNDTRLKHKLYKYKDIENTLNIFSNLFKKAIIENLSFEELILKYDGEKTFFYCDPPYITPDAKRIYGIKKIFDHELLFNIAKTIKGKILISYFYDKDLIDLYKSEGFYIYKLKRFLQSTNTINKEYLKEKSKYREEVLISNYKANNIQLKLFGDMDYN